MTFFDLSIRKCCVLSNLTPNLIHQSKLKTQQKNLERINTEKKYSCNLRTELNY